MKKTSEVKILVVGDVMLDTYVVGEVSRISPEAPVPVVDVSYEYYTLGGCGNVFNNINGIGAGAFCITSFGRDEAGEKIADMIGDSVVVTDNNIETIEKIRVVANHRETQMIRIDKEYNIVKMNKYILDQIAYTNKFIADIIIVSDYGKGMISKDLMSYLRALNTPIIVDPKPSNSFMYGDVFMVTPNEQEYKEMLMMDNTLGLPTLRGADYILQTAGKDGMYLDDLKKEKTIHIKTKASEVYNVTGAGDTVIAVMAVCIAKGLDVLSSAKIANKCASYVVTKPGTTTVPKDVFEKALKQFSKKKKK